MVGRSRARAGRQPVCPTSLLGGLSHEQVQSSVRAVPSEGGRERAAEENASAARDLAYTPRAQDTSLVPWADGARARKFCCSMPPRPAKGH